MANMLSIRNIAPDMKNWCCLVTVQEKQQVTGSMGTPTKKQKLIFYDSEGSKVEDIIFNADIPKMSPILEVYRKYKISNADVRNIPPKFQTSGLTIQWVITARTVIEEVSREEDIMPVKFAFTEFADLAQYMDDKSKFVDVLGVVINSLEKKMVTRSSKQSSVQKFVLLNEESQTVMLSLWDDFLNNEGQILLNNIQTYPVLIGRRLRVNNYNGISLSTWFDSALLVDPPIQEARELKNWFNAFSFTSFINIQYNRSHFFFLIPSFHRSLCRAMRNTKLIASLIETKTYIKYNPKLFLKADQKTTLISNVSLSQKTALVKANISFENIFQKYWYMSCGKCNHATAADYDIEFTCNSCKEKSPAVPRCQFDIDLSDASGVIPASVFGDLAEKLLTFTALEAMDHFNQNHELPLEFVHNSLRTKIFLLHIKPVHTQLEDARQRYTILHYSELEQEIDYAHPTEQLDALPISAEHRIETAQLLTPGESNSGSKARIRLTDKFDEVENTGADDFQIATENANKRTKLG